MFPTPNLSAGSGTTFQNLSPRYTSSGVSSATFVTFLNITGRGILTWMKQTGNGGARVRITIDGVQVLDNQLVNSGSGDTIFLFYGFKQSLLVEHRVVTGGENASTQATYSVG